MATERKRLGKNRKGREILGHGAWEIINTQSEELPFWKHDDLENFTCVSWEWMWLLVKFPEFADV